MDLQGKPINAGQHSTKVATDPQTYNNPIQETSGPVANDSLAAESTRHGGTYSENRHAQPLDVSGTSSTLNNTDTSAATTLPSVHGGGAPSRQQDQPNDMGRYPETLGGQGDYPGAHVPQTGYVGGPTKAKDELGLRAHEYGASGKTNEENPSGYRSQYHGEAPSYVTPVLNNVGNTKPKGQNLHEGGFVDDPRINGSFRTDIGSNKDPGRYAERDFERGLSQNPAGSGPMQHGLDKGSWYQPLNNDQSA